MNQLISDGKLESLQLLSQEYLKNTFDDVRFGFHNNSRGIFGACGPAEMLHLVHTGWWFKNIVEESFLCAGWLREQRREGLQQTLCAD